MTKSIRTASNGIYNALYAKSEESWIESKLLTKLCAPKTSKKSSNMETTIRIFALIRNTPKTPAESVLPYPRIFIFPVWWSKAVTDTNTQPTTVIKKIVKLRNLQTISCPRILGEDKRCPISGTVSNLIP